MTFDAKSHHLLKLQWKEKAKMVATDPNKCLLLNQHRTRQKSILKESKTTQSFRKVGVDATIVRKSVEFSPSISII
jgi:hypothetical protein